VREEDEGALQMSNAVRTPFQSKGKGKRRRKHREKKWEKLCPQTAVDILLTTAVPEAVS